MAEQQEDLYEKYMKILYPGYENMSDKRKENIEFMNMGLIGRLPQVDLLVTAMKDPRSPMYRTGASDKDLVRIADKYAEMLERSHDQVKVPTGRVLRGGPYYDTPEDEYVWKERTEEEIQQAIDMAVDSYNSEPRISIKNIINGVKKYKIDKETARIANDLLYNKKGQDNRTTEEDKEM